METPVRSNATEPDSDADLMLSVKAGSQAALRMLIERWKNPLLNFFYRSTRDYGQAEDLAQLTFIKINRAAATYEPTARFSTFLFHVARRLLINEYRKTSRRPLDHVDPSDLQASTDDNSSREVGEIEEAFALALDKLPENHRTALLLFKQQELSYADIAKAMDATESSVKTWIFRARAELKTQLKELL